MSEEKQTPVQQPEPSNSTNQSAGTPSSDAGEGFAEVACAAADLAQSAVNVVKEAGKKVAKEVGSLALQSQGVPQPVAKILADGAVDQSENKKSNQQPQNVISSLSADAKPSSPGMGG